MKILVYSFDKYDKLTSNPANDVGRSLIKLLSKDFNVKFTELVTSFDSWKNLEKEIKEFKPNFILGLGTCPGRSRISIENIGLNKIHATKPDNKRKQYSNKKIVDKALLAYETNINTNQLLEHLRKENIPAELSFFADTYVCNYVYFNCLRFVNEQAKTTKAVFIHVPLSPKEAIKLGTNVASFPTKLISQSLASYIEKTFTK